MNNEERQIIEVLSRLKKEFGVYEIKAEFEAEGSRMEEMMRLKDIATTVDLPIILKIGGVEAITDIYNALSLGVKGIIAPMAESAFAVQKFLNVIKNMVPTDNAEDIDFAINIETKTAVDNLQNILELPDITLLSGVTVGRVDLLGSMGCDRAEVNTSLIRDICELVFKESRKKGLACGLGGAIDTSAIEFIRYLSNQGLIDKYETRKVVYKSTTDPNFDYESALLKGVEFELLWLKSKRRYYSGIRNEDENRISMLQKRLNR
jgi:4-hydroxy-2-oxoheptanedioate aldolase